jgi:alkyl sulfatase BDS1-like metallo-beta-lactamase superfamily hydrolase
VPAPTDEFEQARRGLLASFDPPRVEDEDGRVVWELGSYDFLDADPPASADPNLWRQGQLGRIAGLFEIVPGFYQLRGFDLSNMHVIEGREGIVVIDPLVSAETAAAALALYREHRGERPVTGLVYTHSHVDHFGGAKGVLTAEEIEARRVPVLAPAGFLHHAVSENVFAGTAMARRAGYMYGALLERGPEGQIGAGLGQTTSLGTITLLPPNLDIVETGQEEVVDGVRMSFQLTPGTEAPAEMNIYFPDACSASPTTPPARCTTSSRRAAPWSATRASGLTTWTRRSSSSASAPTRSSPATTGPAGAASESSTTSKSSATSTPTCTTRPCACSIRATPGPRSPS